MYCRSWYGIEMVVYLYICMSIITVYILTCYCHVYVPVYSYIIFLRMCRCLCLPCDSMRFCVHLQIRPMESCGQFRDNK